jgi:hypothetical protein
MSDASSDAVMIGGKVSSTKLATQMIIATSRVTISGCNQGGTRWDRW